MPKPAFLVMDTLDDRREIHRLLSALSPRERVAYLHWCCKQVYMPNTRINPTPSVRMLPRVSDAQRSGLYEDRLTMEIYFDWWRLANSYKLDVRKAAEELERRVRAKR